MSARRAPLELGPRPKGICPECGGWYQIKRDGTMRQHDRGDFTREIEKDPENRWIGLCPGSDQVPTEPIGDQC